jgi:transcriptional regulator with GAF, ATPase, and Fis domain
VTDGTTPIERPGASNSVSDWNVLWRISSELNSLQDVGAIKRKVLMSALEVAPADRAAILLLDHLEGSTSVIGMERQAYQECQIEVSRTLVNRVVEEGVAILSNDIAEGGTSGSSSPSRRKVQSVLGIPLLIFDRTRGVLYLDGLDLASRFDEDLLQFLAAIGGIAAIAIENVRRFEQLADENRRLRAEIDVEHNMVGESPCMREIYQFIGKVAASDATVLVSGESGTGKELVARAIHANSERAKKPFVAINCAAIAETLLESELFGYEKGAFTGATGQKKGKLETAEGGTVFLDEIGELAPALQAKLLRVLQEREFERVGGTRPIKLNVRLITATNADLQEAVKRGAFRKDLYYRLNVVSVRVPPLRERREDIPLLASYFAAKYAERSKRVVTGLSPEARDCMLRYDWPGNVRELQSAMERAVVLGSASTILIEELPEAVLDRAARSGLAVTRYHEGVQEARKRIILEAIEQTKGHYADAARLLGLHPNYLHRLIRNLNLRDGIGLE